MRSLSLQIHIRREKELDDLNEIKNGFSDEVFNKYLLINTEVTDIIIINTFASIKKGINNSWVDVTRIQRLDNFERLLATDLEPD